MLAVKSCSMISLLYVLVEKLRHPWARLGQVEAAGHHDQQQIGAVGLHRRQRDGLERREVLQVGHGLGLSPGQGLQLVEAGGAGFEGAFAGLLQGELEAG